MYHEANGTTQQEQLLVAQVVLNRHNKTGENICVVINQPNQFSWTKTHKPHKLPPQTLELARAIYRRGYAVKHFMATHFHNHKVQPHWSHQLKLVKHTKYHKYYV